MLSLTLLSFLPSAREQAQEEDVTGPLKLLRQKMADACTITRPTSFFYPIQDAVPHGKLLHVSDRLYDTVPNNPEEQDLSKNTYKVTQNKHNRLLPGLQWEQESDLTEQQRDSGGSQIALPSLLQKRHERVYDIQDSVLARSIRREVELGNEYFYPILIAGLILWSDGLNPNTSKENRGSVWLLLATLILNLGKENPGAYTYPLAVGAAAAVSIQQMMQPFH